MKPGFDIDGVICHNPVVKSPENCLNAERTELNIPSDSHEVYLVSSRSERVRDETEDWLAENGVEYEELVLYDRNISEGWSVRNVFEGLSEREINEKQSKFKADAIDELGLDVFVEDRSSVREHLRKHCPHCVVLPPKEAYRVWRFET